MNNRTNTISKHLKTLTAALLLTAGATAFAQVQAPNHTEQGHSEKGQDQHNHAEHTHDEAQKGHDHAGEMHAEGQDHDHEMHHEARLIYVDGATNTLNVFDPHAVKVTGRFGTPGPISGLYMGPNGRTAYAIHRDDSRVTVLESGLLLVSHGDHSDLQTRNPFVLATLNVGAAPTHFAATEDTVAFFNDKDGTVALLPEALVGVTNDMSVIQVSEPDHGALALMDGVMLAGGLNAGEVEVFDLATGKRTGDVGECERIHGSAHADEHAYFGCVGGVLGVHVHGGKAERMWLPNPAGTPDAVRVGTVRAHDGAGRVYGNFGDGLLSWTPEMKDARVTKLSAAPLGMEFDEEGGALFVLTKDGVLSRVDTATARVTRSVRVLEKLSDEKGAPRPDMVVAEHGILLSDPAHGEIINIDADTLQPMRRFNVGGQPTLLELAHMEGVQH